MTFFSSTMAARVNLAHELSVVILGVDALAGREERIEVGFWAV
jgi:hypothetical protein